MLRVSGAAAAGAAVAGVAGASPAAAAVPLAIADGGTGASSAADARTNLGVAASASPTFTGVVATPALAVSGLSGASSATRYAGGTSSSAPSSGTFSAGDFVVDTSGQVWVCTVAGTPGTWVQAGVGRELGYAEITSNPTGVTGVGPSNRVDITGLSTTVTVGSRPVMVEASFGWGSNSSANCGGGIAIVEGTTVLGQSRGYSTVGLQHFPIKARVRLAPSSGAHTYKVMAWAEAGGTFNLAAGTSTPAFISVVEQ